MSCGCLTCIEYNLWANEMPNFTLKQVEVTALYSQVNFYLPDMKISDVLFPRTWHEVGIYEKYHSFIIMGE